MMRPAHDRGRLVLVLGAVVLGLFLTACTESEEGPGAASPGPSSAAPEGWRNQQVEGLALAVPEEFRDLAGESTSAGVTRKFGIPYTDQTSPPPALQVFVEETEVGPLDVRAPLVVGGLEAELGIDIPDPEEVEVDGAVTAVEFTYDYRTTGGTTSSGTTLEPTDIRQSDVLIETPGLPKYGLRYAAPADQYDEDLWRSLLDSLVVEEQQPDDAEG